jgi:protein-disulfide isomerase
VRHCGAGSGPVYAPTLARIARFLAPILLLSVLGCRSTLTPDRTLPGSDGVAVPSIAEDDAKWGESTAPVTIVWFGDFLCPFTAKSAETIRQLELEYGPERLRVVWKSEPHPFEGRGIELAEAGEVVRALGGSEAFWRFQRLAFANQQDAGAGAYAQWARESGVDPNVFSQKVAARAGAEKVARDHALARQVGVGGTPQFFVNGKPIKGAQPVETFDAAIRLELRQAGDR